MKALHLLVLGAWPELANNLAGLPARVTLVQLPSPEPGREAAWVHRYLPLDYRDVPGTVAAMERLHANDPVDVVVGLRHYSLPALAAVATALGVPSTPGPAHTVAQDKADVRALIAEGAPRPVAYRICRDERELAAFAAETGYPLIVKPVVGAGKEGVHSVRDAAEIGRAWRHAAATGVAVLAEELVTGQELSVELRSVGGRHEVLAVTDKLTTGPPNFVELRHVLPARIGAAEAEAVATEAVRAVTAIGHRDGPTHVEFVLTADGPAVVEINRRMAGDQIFELLHLATGRNLMRESLLDAIGVAHEPPADLGFGAAIRFPVAARSGRVAEPLPAVAVPGLVRARFVVVSGEMVHPPVTNHDRLGQLVTVADTAREAAEAADSADRLIAVRLLEG
ncbi:ATP-grasp domain-containing protein [Amycolatopsis sp. 195334CR]|uniref:ATP-grasp domain-containing protein n=1 Tax=Amycolatopsis sp. 195334CR TaxID=2814588 RepID=UPI001A8D4A9B|nr:ATP-grasp domain-containing protein [Amycolatopsis sp. 195334CR]MBN6038031.1 ATP-grasp domain-containing protein [Amycolatopsis sp. 195334CR]